MKKIFITIPLLWFSCFLPASEAVLIRFPEVPDPWVEFWNGDWEIALTDGTVIQTYLLQRGTGFCVELPCARNWIVRVWPIVSCKLPAPEAACYANSTFEVVYPLWSGGKGARILLERENPGLIQELNLGRFFERLAQLEDPNSLDGEKLAEALQNDSISHYSFNLGTFFPFTLEWPSGQWAAGNWYHPVEKLYSEGLVAGVHVFFSEKKDRILLVTMGETGKILAFAQFVTDSN